MRRNYQVHKAFKTKSYIKHGPLGPIIRFAPISTIAFILSRENSKHSDDLKNIFQLNNIDSMKIIVLKKVF